MASQEELNNIIKAYEFAWNEARKHGDAVLQALNTAEQMTSETSRELFERRAKRELTAYLNWQKSVALCSKTLAEYFEKVGNL
jgi:hypothetical protein